MTVSQRQAVDAIAEGSILISVGRASDPGGRAENEDAMFVGEFAGHGADITEQPGFLLAVADGMGGHEGGEVASQIAIDTVREVLAAGSASDAETAQLIKRAFRQANERIFTRSQETGASEGMGTTLVVAATRGKYATIANVGDSRTYLIRANRLTQVTKDHSLVAQQVADGALAPDQARRSPRRNVLTHALGQGEKLDSKLPSIFEITLLAEDRLLLCSDGFYDVVPDDDLLRTVLGAHPEDAARQLVALANERGTTDNVTAIVASVRAAKVREPVLVGETGARTTPLVPILAAIAAIVIIAVITVVLFLL